MSTCSLVLLVLLAACSLLAPASPPPTPAQAEAQRQFEAQRDAKIADLAEKVGTVTGSAPEKTTAWTGVILSVLGLAGVVAANLKATKVEEKVATATVVGDADHDKNVAEIAELKKQLALLASGVKIPVA